MTERNELFDSWYQSHADYYSAPSDGLVEALHAYAVAPCAALDVGCGQGRNSIWLASQGYQVFALDISSSAIKALQQAANERSLNIDAKVADITNCGISEGRYGVAVVQTTLNHLDSESIPNCCAKISRALKKNGLLYCVAFTVEDPGFSGNQVRESECSPFVRYYFPLGELRRSFPEVAVLSYREYVKADDSHGPRHLHGKAKLVGVKR